MIDNIAILVWTPVAFMLLAMFIWAVLTQVVGHNTTAKTFIKKNSVLGWGWLIISIVTAVILVYKSLTSQLIRPVIEAAPRQERPVLEEVVEAPKDLKDLTLQAKPKDVINKQPETPMVDKALKNAE